MSNEKQSQTDPQKPGNPFGPVEDKSLEAEAREVKGLTDEDDTVTVTMTHHDDHDGKPLIPRRDYDLPRTVAQRLIGARRAILKD